MLLDLKQSLDFGYFSKLQLVFSNLFENMIDFSDNVITSLDIIVEWFMETIRRCIHELDTFLRSYFRDSVVSLLCRDIELVIAHRSRSEQ